MSYDTGRGVTVLFGGNGAGGRLRDTWEWDGTVWSLRSVSGPSARDNHILAYDSVRGATVLFGGLTDGGLNGETWEWDGSDWLLRTTSGPSARFDHGALHDSARHSTLVMGGFDGAPRADSWNWNGQVWRQVSATGPVSRFEHALAFDSARGVAVLFGGHHPEGGGNFTLLGDTWELVGLDVTPPNDQLVTAGTPMLLHADATGTEGRTFQWRKNGVSLSDNERVTGVNTLTLVINPTARADSGLYDLVVENECGAVTSLTASVTVLCAGDLTGDGLIGLDDLSLVLSAFGCTMPPCIGDFNLDGIVDLSDLAILLARFGATCE